jgi:uncharacterized Rmd1/YagE family protein
MAKTFKDKTIAIYNSVIGCKCTREFNEKFLSNLDQYKFLNPFEENESFNESHCYIFFFDYGVVVFWNMTEIEEKSIIAELKPYQVKSNFKIETDYINYEETKIDGEISVNPKTYINNDHLILVGNSFEEKLAVSYALGQSAKLDYFEEDIDLSIEDARSLAEELAKNGYINLDHISLNKKIGKLHLKKNEINLDTDILDIPDYFWNSDKYQSHFNTVSKYFEVSKRTDVINQRLNIIAVNYIQVINRNCFMF